MADLETQANNSPHITLYGPSPTSGIMESILG